MIKHVSIALEPFHALFCVAKVASIVCTNIHENLIWSSTEEMSEII